MNGEHQVTTGLPFEGQTFEGWETGSGMLDNEDITILNASFQFRAEYHNAQTLVLVLEYQTSTGESGEQFLPCGKGWAPGGGGLQMVHDSGKPKKIHPNTAYGEWLSRAIKLAGPTLAQRGPATNAAVWVGTAWHVESVEQTFPQRPVNGVAQPDLTRSTLLPTAFLGVQGVGGPQASAAFTPQPVVQQVAAVQAPMAQTPMPAQQSLQVNGNGVDPMIVQALQQVARQSADQNSYMQEGLKVPGVADNPQATALLLDEQFYAAARSGA
jgi:hypothetical protein